MRFKQSLLVTFLFFKFSLLPVAGQNVFVPRPALPSELDSVTSTETVQTTAEASQESSGEITDEAVTTSQEESTQESDNQNILDTDIVIYPLNEFDDKTVMDSFAKYVKDHPQLKNQIKLEDVSSDGRHLLEASYKETAKPENQLIVLYVAFGIEDKAEAQQALDKNLLLFPDMLVQGELAQQGDAYDLAFTVHPSFDPNTFEMDVTHNEVYYPGTRPDFKYELEVGEEDKRKQAIEERFPGMYKFESEENNGKEVVTVSQLPIEERQMSFLEETSNTGESSDFFDQVKSNVDQFMSDIKLKEKLMSLGISEDNVSVVTMGAAGALVLLGIILIIIGSRRRK